jgi:predicted MPP superfamily phosphohydrolase
MAVPGLPRLNIARFLMTPFDGGWFRSGTSLLHVSRGLGTSGQRIRIGVPRDVSLIVLRCAEA